MSSSAVRTWSGTILALLLGTTAQERRVEFLQKAEIVESRVVGTGINETLRITLTDGVTTHDASFQSVDERAAVKEHPDGTKEVAFVDSYRYNIAAYRLAALLGLSNMVPVSVERTIGGEPGALTWWIDDVRMDEEEMRDRGLLPPDPQSWSEQIYRVRVFNELIQDTDRNRGNLLITSDWKLWMIDFTRAFRRWSKLRHPEWLTRCDRELFAAIEQLSRESLDETLSDVLTSAELKGIWARRALILKHFKELADERGEEQVFY